MSFDVNIANISGHLTGDAEIRQTPNGTTVCNFQVAVNESRKDANGNWQDVPNFIPCAVFGKEADYKSYFLKRGARVAVFGRLRWSEGEKEGQKRQKIEIVVERVEPVQKIQNNTQVTGMPYQDRPANQPAPAPAPAQNAQPVQQPAPTQQPAPASQNQGGSQEQIPF